LYLCNRGRTFYVCAQFSPLSPSRTLDDLAFRVAAEGVDSDRNAVSTMVRTAARLGAPSVLTDLVIDPREPAVSPVSGRSASCCWPTCRPMTTCVGDRAPTTTGHDGAWPARAA
jgi:hypothetical protein